jgi:PAS domain S-box-containing protein
MNFPEKPILHRQPTKAQLLKFSLAEVTGSTWHFDIKKDSYYVDDGFQDIFNIHIDKDLTSKSFLNLISLPHRTSFEKSIQKAISGESGGRFNVVVGAENSDKKLIHFIGQIYLTETGEPGGIIGSAVEIPQSENELLTGQTGAADTSTLTISRNPGEELFRNLISEAPVATCLFVGKEMVIEIANDIMIGYWGKDRSVIGKPLLEAVPELIGQSFVTILDEIYRTGEAHESRNAPAVLKVDGKLSTFYFDFTYKPLFDQDGNIYGIMDMAVDVTAQAIYLKELQASQERLRSIIASAPAAMGIFTGRDLVVNIPNQAFIDIIGKGQNIAGKKLADLLPELESQPFLRLLDEVYTSGVPYQSFGSPLDIFKDGKMIRSYYNISFTPLRDAQGNVYGILDISVDVTENVLAKNKVELAEGSLRNVIELAEIGTWQLDVLTRMVEYSPRIQEWYGLETAGPVPMKILTDMINPADLANVNELIAQAGKPENSSLYSCEYAITSQNGTMRALRDRGQVYYDADGNPVSIRGSVQDITHHIRDKISLEKQVNLRTSQLKDSLADLERSNANLLQFAYIASHDLQEPLRKIQTFSDLLIKRYSTELGAGIDHLNRIQGAASRMSVLIKDLLDFSGISTNQQVAETVQLSQIIESVLLDLEVNISNSGAQIQIGPLPAVRGDGTQLGQLFSNLLSNAIKFRSENTVPRIEINSTLIAREYLPRQVSPSRYAAEYYRINVSDNGIGFDSQYADRIFQVFQRLHSRAEFEGTGIGLAICEKVAANHGGAIMATSIRGQGSVFSIFLPI